MPTPITFLITDLDRGGSPLMLAALAKGLRRRGVLAPTVVSIAPLGEVAEIVVAGGVPVVSLEAQDTRDWGVVGRFGAVLQSARPRLVCSILVHANAVAVAAKGRVRGECVWVQSIHTLQERPRWHWYLQGMLSSAADAIVAPSQAVIRKLAGYGPVPRATVIPNGIDVLRFQNARAFAAGEVPWPAGARVVGYVGRFDPVKRLPVLVRAVGLLHGNGGTAGGRVHLALVGYGAEETRLRGLVDELGCGGWVHFLGASKVPERWMKSFDVFCSPSAAEGFGMTLVEAQVAGLPVVACAAAGVMESLKRAEWISEEPTVGEVAGALARALIGPAKMPESKVGQRFSEERMIECYEEHFVRWIGAGT